jgi:hypothetical protein
MRQLFFYINLDVFRLKVFLDFFRKYSMIYIVRGKNFRKFYKNNFQKF